MEETSSNESLPWGDLGLIAVVLIIAHGTWARREFVTELLDQQQEYAFLESAVPELPRDAEIIAPRMGGISDLDVFPEFLLARSQMQPRIDDLPALGTHAPWPDTHRKLVFYQGMSCYFSSGPPAPARMAQACLEVRRHYSLRPLATTTLKTRGYSQLTYAAGPYEIGFFEATGLP